MGEKGRNMLIVAKQQLSDRTGRPKLPSLAFFARVEARIRKMLKLRVPFCASEPRLVRSLSRRCLFALMLICVALSVRGQVRVNEVMSSNGDTLQDENGDSPDWVELFNAGSEAVNLEGFGLSDNASRPFKWIFGSTTIPAGGYL